MRNNPEKIIKAIVSNVWHDKEKLETVKAPPSKSVLVVKRSGEEETTENQSIVENTITNNNISVIESYKNKLGDVMVVCESKDTHDEWKISNEEIATKFNTQSIVGLPKE